MAGQVSEVRVGQRVLSAKLISFDPTGAGGLWEDFSFSKESWAEVGARQVGVGAWIWGVESRSGKFLKR